MQADNVPNFHGPWRILRNGGSPTNSIDNVKEEYTGNSNATRYTLIQRYPSVVALVDVDPVRPAPSGSHVSWSSHSNGVETRYGALYPNAGAKQDASVGAKTIVTASDNNTFTLGKGYGAGSSLSGRIYGLIYLARVATTAEQAKVKAYMLGKIGSTTS
jgi:hypothetical protein